MKTQDFFESIYGISILSILFAFFSGLSPYFFEKIGVLGTNQNFFVSIGALILMGFLPAFIIKKFFKSPLSDFGWRLPEDIKKATFFTLGGFVLLLPFIIYFSGEKSFEAYYGLEDVSLFRFLIVAMVLPLFYYLGEEFLFRGFFFLGLWRKIGNDSFWITSLVFALFHLGKPPLELIFAFIASLVFSYMSLKTKSFLPAVILHFLLAVTLNILVTFFFREASLGPILVF